MYEIEKPVNLHWQRSLSVKLSYGYSRNKNTDKFFEEPETMATIDQLKLETGFEYGIGYFPNSRTDLTGQVSIDFEQLNRLQNDDNPDTKSINYSLEPEIILALHYYISPQCRLNVNYDIRYYYTKNNYWDDTYADYSYLKSNTLTQHLRVGFTYSFF
jgi:hypothetical protein